MSKFHIDKNGKPAPCRAKPGNCPRGGDDTHFDSEKEAQEFIDKENENKYGKLPDVHGNKSPFGTSNHFNSIEEAQNQADKQNEREYGLNKSSMDNEAYFNSIEDAQKQADKQNEQEYGLNKEKDSMVGGSYVGYYYDLSEGANNDMIQTADPFMTKENFNEVLDSGFNKGDIDVKYEFDNPDNTSLLYEGTLVRVGDDKYKATGEFNEYTYEERDFDTKEEFDEYVKEGHDENYKVDLEFTGDELRETLERVGPFYDDWKVNRYQAPPTILRGVFGLIRENK